MFGYLLNQIFYIILNEKIKEGYIFTKEQLNKIYTKKYVKQVKEYIEHIQIQTETPIWNSDIYNQYIKRKRKDEWVIIAPLNLRQKKI